MQALQVEFEAAKRSLKLFLLRCRHKKRLARSMLFGALTTLAIILLLRLLSRQTLTKASSHLDATPVAANSDPVADSPFKAAAFANEAPWVAKRPAEEAQLLIPKKIHHYFGKATGIPVRLVPEIHSWAVVHPEFEIHYWDAATVEGSLLSRPEYARFNAYYWNGTHSRYERDLIARLIILHSVGGLLPELNMRSLRNVTTYLLDTSCLIAQDRNEKAVFSHGFESLPSLAFLACKPRHHFVDYFLRKVTEVGLRTGAVVLEVDTPVFLLHAYNAAVAAYDEECSTRADCIFRDRVSLADPQVFMPVMEPQLFESLVDNCRYRARLEFLRKEACYNLDANGNEPSDVSLAMPVYLPSWATNKDRPLLPLTKIGPASALAIATRRKPRKHWRFPGDEP